MIQTPDHSSFPSGHSTESFALATVMNRLLQRKSALGEVDASETATDLNNAAQSFRLAERAAANRTVAGVHFPCDSAAGAVLGVALGEAVYALACGYAVEAGTKFTIGNTGNPGEFAETDDLSLNWVGDAAGLLSFCKPEKDPANGIIRKSWELAHEEWGG